ncbi:MAG: class D sortase [Acidobacteriota bacterium]
MKQLKILEYAAWVVGFALVGFYFLSRGQSATARASDIEAFTEAKASLPETGPLDFSLWSEGRIQKYEQSLSADLGLPMAILRIPRIDLEVPVLEGTGDLVLDRAVGRIEGTSGPGDLGNFGIAGHRDGVFRRLKDLSIGDWIEVETLTGQRSYQIDKISIVAPTKVEVLEPTGTPVITLVTCYPFYFVGKAPQRYIVRASLKQPGSLPTAETDQVEAID